MYTLPNQVDLNTWTLLQEKEMKIQLFSVNKSSLSFTFSKWYNNPRTLLPSLISQII